MSTGPAHGSEMVKMKRLPPRCPYCGERLVKVGEDGRSSYVFDPTSGTYRFDDGDLEPYCPHCEAELYDVFPEGACNYISKARKKNI